MAEQKYKVLIPIAGKKGKVEHEIGDVIPLDKAQAERFLRAKAVEGPVQEKAAKASKSDKGQTFDPANVTDEEILELGRPELEAVAKLEEIQGIGDKNKQVLADEILAARKARAGE